MVTVRTPRSTSSRSSFCSSTGPGVVSPLPPGIATPSLPTSTPRVPMEAAGCSGESRRCRSSPTVVVLPLVPVTPTSVSSRAGHP